jgi:hypothetical protein
MPWLTLWFALQLGLSPNSMMVIYPTQDQRFFPFTSYVELATEARVGEHFFIGGELRTEIQKETGIFSFTPEMASYGFKAGLRWPGVEVAGLYACEHPVVPYFDYYHPVLNWEGWYGEVYVKFSGEVHP